MKRSITFAALMCLLMGTTSLANEKWPLGADLNGDGTVNFLDMAILSRDWLQSNCTAEEDLLNRATFTRNSVAFLDGKEYAPHAPRRKLIAIAEVSDCQIHDQENITGVGPVVLSPKCTAGGYIYATETDHSNIYRSRDGITWEQTADSLTGVDKMFGTQTGAILVAKAVGGNMKLFRSTTGGSDLADANLPAPALTLPNYSGTYLATVAFWNFHQARNGTICLGEYGSTGFWVFDRSRLYRSTDDGATFTQVYDDPDGVRHSHRIMKHEATGRWVNVYGDGGALSKVVKSDDDGITWSTLDPQGENNFQPVEFYDYGHPTNLLYGSDDSGFMGTFDVLTREINPVYSDGDRTFPFVFSIYYHDGVFYAGTFSSPNVNDRRTAILASSDLVNWAVYHQFRNGEKMVNRFSGFFGGRIHGIVTMSDDVTWRHFSFTPTTVKVVNGLCLDPATTNMLDTEQYSSVESDVTGWSAVIGTATRITTDAVHGSACLRVDGNSGVECIYPRSRPVVVGKTYNGRVWLKANGQNLSGCVRWYIFGSSRYGSYNFFCLSRDEWTEIVLEPVTIATGETHITIFIIPRSSTYPGPYDILVDAAQYEEGPPTRWQVGGIPRTDETLSKTVTTPAEWTELISWAPECRSEWYANSGNQYIKSWCKDADNYVELYFDPCDSTFAMQATVAGSPQTPVKSSAYTFYRNSVIRLAIRCDESSLRLSVSAAGPYEHISGTAVDFLRSATLTSKTGDHNGTGVMSCTLLSDKIYDGVMNFD